VFKTGGSAPKPPDPEPPPPDSPPQQTACFLELKYRALGGGVPLANHAYLWMGTAMGTITSEGFPQSPKPSYGNLVAMISPNGLSGTNAVGDSEWGPELESADFGNGAMVDPNLCSQNGSILSAETTYNQHQTTYRPAGPNSNALAHFFLTAGGLGWVFTAPPWTVVWDAPLCPPPPQNRYHRYRPS